MVTHHNISPFHVGVILAKSSAARPALLAHWGRSHGPGMSWMAQTTLDSPLSGSWGCWGCVLPSLCHRTTPWCVVQEANLTVRDCLDPRGEDMFLQRQKSGPMRCSRRPWNTWSRPP